MSDQQAGGYEFSLFPYKSQILPFVFVKQRFYWIAKSGSAKSLRKNALESLLTGALDGRSPQ
ncbi:hypothetical protein [uncultured Gimesia sp.]|jgi:hypothetical protein|uniref:hypothetical protein n=1 Tax=uncultured Gimesia sp. TaxID=1678688 RepID=UPI0026074C72|nr:hypothetical protein [uncultured Gimesia sp.]